MEPIIYLNGDYVPLNQAFISPNDRGFYFGDGVYEVLKYYKNTPLWPEQHHRRLENSLNELKIPVPKDFDAIATGEELIRRNGSENEYVAVYIQITRGAAPRTHHFPAASTPPTVYATITGKMADVAAMRQGVRTILREDIRWKRCDIKSISLLANTLAYQEAIENHASECLFERDGLITESTHCSVFGVRKGRVCMYPSGRYILPGVTREIVLSICGELNIEVEEKPVGVDELASIDELFLAGTGKEITPIVAVNEHVIGEGTPGPVCRKIQEAFFRLTYKQLAGEQFDRYIWEIYD